MASESDEESFPPPPQLTVKTPRLKRKAPPPPPAPQQPPPPPPPPPPQQASPPSPSSLHSNQTPSTPLSEEDEPPTFLSAPLYPPYLVTISRDIEISQNSPSQTLSDTEEFPPLPDLPQRKTIKEFWRSKKVNLANVCVDLKNVFESMERALSIIKQT